MIALIIRIKASLLVVCFVLLLASCNETTTKAPSLTLTPTTASANAGSAAMTFKATLENASGEVAWTLEPALGTLSSAKGTEISYTPPATVAEATIVTLTAALDKLSTKATITISPLAPGEEPSEPSIQIDPPTMTMMTGSSPVTFQAIVANSNEAVNWSLTGPGKLSVSSGANVDYTPPTNLVGGSATTLTATLGSTGKSATASITLTTPQTAIFADPVLGADTNDGAEDAPVKTIRHALTLAKGGKTVYLAGGTYNETSGETFLDETDGKFGYVIPEGTQLTPDPRKDTTPVLFKTNAGGGYGFRFEGSGRISLLKMEGFREAISATTGTQDLYGINMKGIGEHGIALKGTANLTCSSCGISVDDYYALYLEESAKLKLDGNSSVNLESPLSTFFIYVIYITTGSTAVADLELNGATTIGGYNIFGGKLSLNKVDLRLRNLYGDVIRVAADAELSMTDGRVSGGWFNSGGSNEQALVSSGTLTINGTRFEGNQGGAIELEGGTATIQNATFQNIGDAGTNYAGFGLNAITVYKATKLTVRTTTIKNIKAAFNSTPPVPGENGVGIYIADASAGIDLGTEALPGRNVFQDCGAWCVQVSGQGSSTGTVQAVGNIWNASKQGADASGNYSKQTVAPSSYTYGDNYYVSYPNVIQF